MVVALPAFTYVSATGVNVNILTEGVAVNVGVFVGVFVGGNVMVGVDVGAFESTTQVRLAGLESKLPAASMALTWKV